MKKVRGMALLAGASVCVLLIPRPVAAQACKDEMSMVEGSKQSLVDLMETVRKETLADFERLNHQKSAVSKLTIHDSMVGGLVSCLEKAAQDATLPKEQAEAAKTQRDAYAKLLEKLQHERGAIKDAQVPKDAKALVEKLDLAS